MRLDLLAKAAKELGEADNHSVLIYGPPKTGKTQFVATAAKIPEIERIFWFDLEKGYETLLHMGLEPHEMQKIYIISIPDTRRNPVAIETMLRSLAGGKAVNICEAHGKIDCVDCKKAGAEITSFDLNACTHKDIVVVDSGSQLGDSALAAACLGKDVSFKPGFDEYGLAGFWLSDILSVIQQCKTTNFVVITHELIDEEEINGKKTDKIFPLMGTRAFCRKVAKYFGTVCYFHLKLGKHVAGSSSTYRTDTMTGSRVGAQLEKSQALSMRDILISGGIIKSATAAPAPAVKPSIFKKP